MAETYASEGNIVTLPGGDNELVERAKTGFELFNTSSDALVFVADRDGNILMHTGKDVAESAKIPQNLQEEMDSGKDIFLMGTMDDTLHDKYYIAGRRVNLGGSEGYLFAATPVHALAVYIRSILTMFLLSSAVILIVCWRILPRPLTTWRAACKTLITPAGSLWATLPMNCAPP